MKKRIKILIIFFAVFAGLAGFAAANASAYKMAVNIIDEMDAIGVNPTTSTLDFGNLPRNNGAVRYITVSNSGKIPVYLMILKYGGLSDLVKVNKSFLTINPGEEEKLSFMLSIPSSARTKKYFGNVLIFHFPKFF